MKIDRNIFAQPQKKKEEILLATITEISSEGVKIRFDGEENASNKICKRNKSITFKVGDRVKVLPYSGTYIVEYPIN